MSRISTDDTHQPEAETAVASNRQKPPVTWPEACQNILVKAMVSGNVVKLGLIASVCLLVWKMDGRACVDMLGMFLQSKLYSTLGWVLFLVVSGISILCFRLLRRIHREEMDRLVTERNALQAQLTASTIQSSHQQKQLEYKK